LPGTAGPSKPSTGNDTRKAAPNYKVRMDPSNRTLDSMISVPHPSQIGDFIESSHREEDRPSKRRAIAVDADPEDDTLEEDIVDLGNSSWNKGSTAIPESECEFTSIQQLRRDVSKGNQGKLGILFLEAGLIVRCRAYNAQTCFRWYRRLVFGIISDSIFNQTLPSKSYEFSVSPTCSIFLGMC